MNKTLFALITILSISYSASAQFTKDSLTKNQIKINILSLVAFNTIDLTYEYTIKPNLTFGGTIGGSIRSSQPTFLNFGEVSELSFSGHRFQTFAVMQQLKWYPKFSERNAPHGFYFGGLLRFQNLTYSSSILYESSTTTTANVNLEASMSSLAAGIELGYQIKFKKNILLDFSFFGPRINFNTFIATLDAEVGNEFLNELSNEVNNALGFGIFNPDITLTETFAERFTFLGLRYAISVGYCF